ncbi:DedA family protein [Brachybacterium sp. P6-10-X1]|uniref:DedA family protein n=1 Tax=Brachybacterium sp. P6-10-X1 TaxID=1903186 RepID=UPI0009FACB4A|nr:VTT domain-containing protein [Brachybacterium sp. P6-10-X1]
MMEWVRSLPLLPAVGFLYVVIWMRAGATYAVGRAARRAARRGRVAAFLESPRVQRATEIVHRWGAPVVALSFLTVGFQTAANAAAGLTGMPLKRYLPALALGGLAWAVIYATIGLVAVAAWFELFLRSPWAAVAVLALVVVLIAVLLRHRRRGGGVLAARDEDEEDEEAAPRRGEGRRRRDGQGVPRDDRR